MEAMSAHYMDLSQDNLFVLIDMFEEEAKARTFALMRPESLRRVTLLSGDPGYQRGLCFGEVCRRLQAMQAITW